MSVKVVLPEGRSLSEQLSIHDERVMELVTIIVFAHSTSETFAEAGEIATKAARNPNEFFFISHSLGYLEAKLKANYHDDNE